MDVKHLCHNFSNNFRELFRRKTARKQDKHKQKAGFP
jgi:hypothetical protein